MQVRIAIAVEPDQGRWIAYGASDTPEREVVATLRDIVGGRSATYERALAEARAVAMSEMTKRAEEMGANGVIGVDLDYEVLGQANGMLMVSCSGTAILC